MAKPQAFPLVLRISSQPAKMMTLKPVSLFSGFNSICGSGRKTRGLLLFNRSGAPSVNFSMENVFFNCSILGARSFSSSYSRNEAERSGKSFPWLENPKGNKKSNLPRVEAGTGSRSSWEESAEKYLKNGTSNVGVREETKKFESRRNESRGVDERIQEGERGKYVRGGVSRVGDRENRKFESRRNGLRGVDETRKFESRRNGLRGVDESIESGGQRVEIRETQRFESRRNGLRGVDERSTEEEQVDDDEGEEKDEEIVNDPRWNNIQNRVNKFTGFDNPNVRKYNNQENWGKKTWKEAKESTVPNMVGESIYGVGPVLAALSANRREFYRLYIQEGIDFTSNNRKKKDKKAFEKVLKIAEKIGLIKKEISKHDLNMVADNRPHQGLVLDASPLEMVTIKQLEPVSIEGENKPLWLALDEVTDPQNLGAIIRSAYFFGASGVVLCAKNSAPLSGVVSKASAGSLELMELRSCKNMMNFLTSSAENGWRVLGGSVSSRAVRLSEVAPGPPTVLVMGSEGTGLRPLVERSCTDLVRIPGNIPADLGNILADLGGDEGENLGREFGSFLAVESLNVSVAAGVMLNHLIGGNNDESSIVREE